jgi:hypothetical protein
VLYRSVSKTSTCERNLTDTVTDDAIFPLFSLLRGDRDFRLDRDVVDPGVTTLLLVLDEDNFPAGDALRAIPSKSALVDFRLLLLNITEGRERDCLSMGRSPRES